jgi:hypothetical protein
VPKCEEVMPTPANLHGERNADGRKISVIISRHGKEEKEPGDASRGKSKLFVRQGWNAAVVSYKTAC